MHTQIVSKLLSQKVACFSANSHHPHGNQERERVRYWRLRQLLLHQAGWQSVGCYYNSARFVLEHV